MTAETTTTGIGAPQPTARRRRWPWFAAAGVLLAAAAAGYWYAARPPVAAAPGGPFDLETAMTLIGDQVPAETESFYFFVLEPQQRGEARELAAKMLQAAGEHDFIGITGADAGHNRAVLLAALAAPREHDLAGLIVIYAGPPEQEAELRQIVSGSGAELRFVAYTTTAETI